LSLGTRIGIFIITPATKYINASSPDAVKTGFAQMLLTCLIAGLIIFPVSLSDHVPPASNEGFIPYFTPDLFLFASPLLFIFID
jgi:hypothetical protein